MASIPSFQDFDSTVCFANRWQAGEQLALAVLQELSDRPIAGNPRFVVYALPRGGLPVAAPIAQRLHCPLDVIVAKKITRPENPELAIGAVTADGQVLWLSQSRSPQSQSPQPSGDGHEMAFHQAQERAQKQWTQFALSRPAVNPTEAIALIVDDGIATGMTMAVAAQALRAQHPAEIWLCVPVAPPEILPSLQTWGDRVIVLAAPSPFNSVSRFYREFNQVHLEDAIACLQQTNLQL